MIAKNLFGFGIQVIAYAFIARLGTELMASVLLAGSLYAMTGLLPFPIDAALLDRTSFVREISAMTAITFSTQLAFKELGPRSSQHTKKHPVSHSCE